MALSRAGGLCRLALRTQWACVRLLSTVAAGGEPPGDEYKPGRLVDLTTLRRERALRPPAERTQPAPALKVYSTPAPRYEQVQLNKAIRDSTSVDAVLDLVASQPTLLDYVGASSALSKIAKLFGNREPALWLNEDKRFKQLMKAASSLMERGAMDAQGFSNMLYACGQLGIAPPPSWLRVYWESSALVLSESVPQAHSNTLYACGQLGIIPPAEWLQRYWHFSALKLGEFKPQALSNTLYACGQLGITPPAEWLQRYWHASASKLGEFNEQALSNTLYASGLLAITPPARWLQQFWLASSSNLTEFVPQAHSNTLYACGQLGITPPADWLQRYWHATALKLGENKPQNFSNMLYACGQLDITPPREWLVRFWHASALKLGEFIPQNFSNTLYAFGQLVITPPADWLQRYWHASASKLGEFNPQELSNTLYACGQLGITPPSEWLQRYWHASALKLGEFKPQELSNTMYACGQLGVVPPADWLHSCSDSFEQLLPETNGHDLSNSVFSLATLGLWELPVFPGLWERLIRAQPRDTSDWSAENQLQARQLYQAYQAAAVERPGLLSAPSPELLAAARKSWIDGMDETSSRLHEQVSACLTRLGIAHANERWCERAERSVDIAIEGAAPVALEVDGPYHFLQDGRQDGRTQMRNRMLAAHGWRVVVVDYRVWDGLQTEVQREEYLRRLFAWV